MSIRIEVLHRGDENILMRVAAEVFDKPVEPELVREFLEDPRHHIAVAIDEGKDLKSIDLGRCLQTPLYSTDLTDLHGSAK
jgi:hypothetical protein